MSGSLYGSSDKAGVNLTNLTITRTDTVHLPSRQTSESVLNNIISVIVSVQACPPTPPRCPYCRGWPPPGTGPGRTPPTPACPAAGPHHPPLSECMRKIIVRIKLITHGIHFIFYSQQINEQRVLFQSSSSTRHGKGKLIQTDNCVGASDNNTYYF